MWRLECSDDGKNIKETVNVSGKVEACLSRTVLSTKYKFVYVFDDEGDFIDEVEL